MTTGINKIRELTNKPITLGGYTYIQPKKLKPVKIPSISDILKQKAQDFKTGLGVVGEEISKLAKPLLTPVEKRPTKAMEFRVGEGLSEEKRISIQTPSGFASVSEKQNAVNKIKELAEGGKVFKKGNLFVDILQALPRAAKQIQLSAVKIENEQATMFPELASKLSGDRSITFQPKTPEERFLFGADEVKDVEGTGKNILKDFGASDETATKYGLLT